MLTLMQCLFRISLNNANMHVSYQQLISKAGRGKAHHLAPSAMIACKSDGCFLDEKDLVRS